MSKHSKTGFTILRDEFPLRVTAYSGSNYATDIDDRKSVTGKVIFRRALAGHVRHVKSDDARYLVSRGRAYRALHDVPCRTRGDQK